MRSSSHSSIPNGNLDCTETHHTERDRRDCENTLYILGIGPGSLDHISKRAHEVLKSVSTVAGYTTYIKLIQTLIQDKQVISTPMMKEVERVEAAVETVLQGQSCAIVCSGDPGVYAMAGLVLEFCKKREIQIGRNETSKIKIEVIPGIPALCSGASLLGAPLTHDFAAVSLSDLLTTWEIIEQRIDAAAKADFVIVIYNPKSKKRDWQLEAAQKIILKHRDKDTPVGIVTSAMRDEQYVKITSLGALHTAPVDMQTTIFIGNSTSLTYLDFMITPRGYAKKYQMEKS